MNRFDNHQVFGLDLDKTIIKGPCSYLIQDYIKNNPTKTFHIITFRFGFEFEQVERDLNENFISKDLFSSVVGQPRQLGMLYGKVAFPYREAMARNNAGKAERVLKHHKMTFQDYTDLETEVQYWKAKTCVELGATVLVDDLAAFVEDGCKFHGIEFINSLEINP